MGLLDAFKNTNIFGARRPTYLEGIATPEQLKQAEQQSLVQGLLGTAVGYLAQPKNQGYGSAIPYLAKGYLQGMQSAQSPYQGLERDVLMKSKFQDIQREQDIAKQQRQLTEQLMNDPRVQGNPLREQMALTNPVELSKQLEERINLREGAVLTDREGNILVENVKEEKPPKFTELYGTPQQDPRYGLVYFPKDPQRPILDAKGKAIPDYKPLPKESTAKPTTPSVPTDTTIKNTKNRLNAAHGFNLDIKEEDDKTVAMAINSRANQIMATKKVSFDDAIDMAVSEFEEAGSVSTTEPFLGLFGGGKTIDPAKTVKKKKPLSEFN